MQSDTQDRLLACALSEPAIAAIVPAIESSNADVYLVGGTVRDLIVGRAFIDVDLAVDGDPSGLAAQIGASAGPETKFGTLSVQRDHHRYDLARTRSESYQHPGALPAVAPAGIDADLGRRDFTVNALALGLAGPRAGELIAAPGALEDLAARRLAVLHDLSFRDDPTRLLRLVRYAARLRFSIAAHTRELATEAIAGGALETVSGNRIGNELRLLAAEPDPVAAFEASAALGLPWSIDADPAREALAVLPSDGRRDLLALACVFARVPAEQLLPELDRLGFTAGDRDMIAQAAGQSGYLARRLSSATTPSEIARAVGTSAIETVALASSQGARSQALAWLRDLRHRTLDITGQDLIENGIPEGPEIGRALARARAALLDGEATDRRSQLEVALKRAE